MAGGFLATSLEVPKRRNVDPAPQERWRTQPQSGLTIAEFYRKHRCSTVAFLEWRGKLADPLNTAVFYPARLHRASAPQEPLRVCLASGAVVEIPARRADTLVQLVDRANVLRRQASRDRTDSHADIFLYAQAADLR